MLVIKRSGADRSTFLDRWETHVVVRNDAEVGRIEIAAPGSHTIDGHVTFQGKQFQCRIHPGAGPNRQMDHVHRGRRIPLAARNSRTFLIDGVPGLQDYFGCAERGLWVLDMDLFGYPTNGGSARSGFCAGGSFPSPERHSMSSKRRRTCQETLEIFLAWIVVQGAFDFG